MSSSLESTPPGPLSPEVSARPLRLSLEEEEHHQRQSSVRRRSRKGSKTIEVTPYTTFYTSTPRPQPSLLQRQAAMSLLLKTSEGRERSLRFIQNILRLYIVLAMARSPLSSAVYRTKDVDSASAPLKARARAAAPPKTTRLLLLVFLISAFRKLRNLSELLAPLTPSSTNARLRALAGSADLTPGAPVVSASTSSSSSNTPSTLDNISSTRWLWIQKHAWAGVDPKDESINAAVPPVSDEQSTMLRSRLESLEVTLSLLDTVSDGVALFARLGITLSLPFKALQQRLRKRAGSLSTERSRNVFQKLFVRAESLADVFWLLSTLVCAIHSEWERREVWRYGRRVRRLMREEEIERDRLEREQELSVMADEEGEREGYISNRPSEIDGARHSQGDSISAPEDGEAQLQERMLEHERHVQRIRNQRRTLRDLRGRLTWLWWDRIRLGADAVFALYDLFEWRTGSEGVRAIAGAMSAGVGFSQIWSESTRYSKLAHKPRRSSM